MVWWLLESKFIYKMMVKPNEKYNKWEKEKAKEKKTQRLKQKKGKRNKSTFSGKKLR